jgi:hypothetical protein
LSLLDGRILFVWFLANVLLFTPAQQENLLIGIGLANVMPLAFIVAAMLAITSTLRPMTKFAMAVGLCVLATYSMGNGMMAWPAVGVALLGWNDAHDSLRSKRKLAVPWTIATIVCVAPYFIGFSVEAPGPRPPAPPLWAILLYIPTFLGGMFQWSTPFHPRYVASTFGIVMLVLLALVWLYWAIRRRQRDTPATARMMIWLGVALYAICNATMAASGRAELGVAQALASRYAVFASALPLALVYLVAIIFNNHSNLARSVRVYLPLLAGIGLVLLQAATFPEARQMSRVSQAERRHGKAALMLIKVLPDNPSIPMLVHPFPGRVYPEVLALNQIGYIHPPLIETNRAADFAAPVSLARGKLEAAAESAPGWLTVRGWAIFPHKHSAADAVFLTYQNDPNQPILFATAPRRLDRDGEPVNSGWEATFPINRLPPSSARLTIHAWALDTDTGLAHMLDGEWVRE